MAASPAQELLIPCLSPTHELKTLYSSAEDWSNKLWYSHNGMPPKKKKKKSERKEKNKVGKRKECQSFLLTLEDAHNTLKKKSKLQTVYLVTYFS